MSATPDSTLANPEQRIADLERQLAEREAELAECKAECDEALRQQTATAEVLGVINSSPGDLVPVFEAILEKAHTLCGAALGSFCLNDGERMPAVATRGYSKEHAALARKGLPTRGPTGERLARGEIVHIPDIREFAGSQDQTVNAINRAAVEITGSRTYLAVPMRKEGVLLAQRSPQGGAALHRQADRAVAELRGTGGHRNGERSADYRDT